MSAASGFFPISDPMPYRGPGSSDPFAFRWYNPDQVVLGRRMEDHLRFALCWWHSLSWPGGDPFGGETFHRPWMQPGDPMTRAREKAEIGFQLLRILRIPFYTFHDRDMAPEGASIAESERNLREMEDWLQEQQSRTGIRLLWGTANLFSHRRYMAGAATNPDPQVFLFACAQLQTALEMTHRLGGANYVMWGGREGYETLLNTDLKRELDNAGRMLALVVEHKHKIGFKGPILIEPKPREPTKHQYDYDVATVYGFLKAYGLEQDVKVNIEQNHATLAGHSFEHEIALATALGIMGSIDLNRGDELLGWDTDQFANNVPNLALALHALLLGGGFTTGGMNFDAKIRRQSLDPADLIHGHRGAMDACARALLLAAKIIEDGRLDAARRARYTGWEGLEGQKIHDPTSSLESLAAYAREAALDPQPRSGRQEYLENLLNDLT